MAETHHFVRVNFRSFKAFDTFALQLRHFNILVGPNNSGKSTILAAFRILAAGMRTANRRRPRLIHGPTGQTMGYSVDLRAISIAEENIFYNYDDSCGFSGPWDPRLSRAFPPVVPSRVSRISLP